MITQKFPCTRKDLAPIVRLGIKKLSTIADALSALKPKYSSIFFDQFLAEINTYELLPDRAASIAQVKNLNVDRFEKRKTVLNANVKLESYIRDAFEEEKHDTMFKAAGNTYWDKAKKGDTGSILSLLSSMTEFVDKYKTELMANNNMPAKFIEELTAIDTDFRQTNSDSEDAQAFALGSKDAKLGAGNAIYAKLMGCLLDAQALKDSDKDWVRQFTFTAFANQVETTANAGFSGKITEDGTKTGIENVLIIVKGFNKAVETEADGRYEFTPLSMGKYLATFEAEGYEPQTLEVVIKTGVMTRVNVKLKALAAKAGAMKAA